MAANFRPSDLLGVPDELVGAEFFPWCRLAIILWKADPCLEREFGCIPDFLDWAFATAEALIRSAQEEIL
jgi:hypothetical protein